MNEKNVSGLFFLGLFLAIGMSLGGYFIGQTMYNAKVALNTAEAKGLAERRVEADRANWQINFSVASSKQADIPNLYKKSEEIQDKITTLLKEQGFDENEIKPGIIDYRYTEYRDDKQILVDQRHTLTGTISVETGKVKQIAGARTEINKLIAQGINIENLAPTYHFTKLNEIKPDMLREATQNARIAANEFAKNAGAHVGRIRSAQQGNFYIRDAGEEYGDTAKIEKDVRVVTTITFYLTD